MDPYLVYLISTALLVWTILATIFVLIMIWLLMKDNDEKPQQYPDEVNWLLSMED